MPAATLEVPADFTVEGGYEAAQKLIALPERPTAIFGFNDDMAIGAMQALRAAGLEVPRDVSVVGFDDTEPAPIVTPRLTTVRQPLGEMGRMAVSLFQRLLGGQGVEAPRIELATRLVVRDSSGPVPGS